MSRAVREMNMAPGQMQTRLIRSTDETGALEWRLPSGVEGFIENLPEEKREQMRAAMRMALSACAHAICAEVDYSIRTGCAPMRDMLGALAALSAVQMQRLKDPREPPVASKKH